MLLLLLLLLLQLLPLLRRRRRCMLSGSVLVYAGPCAAAMLHTGAEVIVLLCACLHLRDLQLRRRQRMRRRPPRRRLTLRLRHCVRKRRLRARWRMPWTCSGGERIVCGFRLSWRRICCMHAIGRRVMRVRWRSSGSARRARPPPHCWHGSGGRVDLHVVRCGWRGGASIVWGARLIVQVGRPIVPWQGSLYALTESSLSFDTRQD